jgi:ABC-2 type transport system permease protein
MNVFFRELKANRKALIIWSICMFLLVVSGMGKYTAYSSGGASADIFASMPFSIKVLLGIGSFDVTTLGGFFAFLFPYLEITVAIHAGLIGTNIIAKEEIDKTAEFLMVKPLSRTAILLAKLAAAAINILVINIVTLFSSIAIVAAYNKKESISSEIALLFISMLIVQLIFFSMGAFFAAFLKKSKGAGSLTMAVLLGGFILSKVTVLSPQLEILNVLSPVTYFSIDDIVNKTSLNLVILLLGSLLSASLLAACVYFYNKRNLSV